MVIKFRAWDKELNFFCDPLAYYVGLDGSAWFNNCGSGEDDMIDQSFKLVVEQFTGLYDKNGKEIYEGDIVKYDSQTLVVVLDSDASFAFRDTRDDHGGYSGNLVYSSPVEVIGNIHDNPELLD